MPIGAFLQKRRQAAGTPKRASRAKTSLSLSRALTVTELASRDCDCGHSITRCC